MNGSWWLLTAPRHLSSGPKKQRCFYSGKKKRHTLKTQVIIDYETSTILGIAQEQGPTSDLKLFKQSGVHLAPEVWYLADGGY